jgi:hypothetical protein
MKKVTLTVPWGQYDPIVKRTRIKHSLLQCFFSPNNISQQVCTEISTDRQTRLCLSKFRKNTEADTEIYGKCITTRK